MIDDKRNEIYILIGAGRTDNYICRAMRISRGSLAAYKAAWSRRENQTSANASSWLAQYFENNQGVYISAIKILGKLDSRQISNLVDILQVISEDETVTQNSRNNILGNHTNNRTTTRKLPSSEVRRIVVELRMGGVKSEDVYKDERLKGVNKWEIAGYLSHVTAGTYKDRELE